MRLDGTRLRARRLQLGMTMRGLAWEAGISQTLVKRLEETGDIDSLTCATLQRLVDALSVDLIDMFEDRELSSSGDERLLERLGPILLGRRSGIRTTALANVLAVETTVIEDRLLVLADRLQPAGIRVHRGSTGIRLVPVERVSEPSDSPGYLQAPTSSDLRLLHRVLCGNLQTREVAAMKNGNVSLHRLMRARLVEVRRSGAVDIGPAARDSLLVDPDESPQVASNA